MRGLNKHIISDTIQIKEFNSMRMVIDVNQWLSGNKVEIISIDYIKTSTGIVTCYITYKV
jgi:hypothetical protein